MLKWQDAKSIWNREKGILENWADFAMLTKITNVGKTLVVAQGMMD